MATTAEKRAKERPGFHFVLDAEDRRALEEAAALVRLSLSDTARLAIREYRKKLGRKSPDKSGV